MRNEHARWIVIALGVVGLLLVIDIALTQSLINRTDRLESISRQFDIYELKMNTLAGVPKQLEFNTDELRKLSTQARFLERFNDRKGDPLWIEMSVDKRKEK